MTSIKKGDIVLIEFPFSDGVGSKSRPAMVLSGDKVHEKGDILAVQITSKQRDDSLNIPLTEQDLERPLPLTSFVRVHKIFVIEATLVRRVISRVHAQKYAEVVKAIIDVIQ